MSAASSSRPMVTADDDSDDDISYFTAPKRKYIAPLAPKAFRSPSPERHATSSDDTDTEDGPRKHRTKLKGKPRVRPKAKKKVHTDAFDEWSRRMRKGAAEVDEVEQSRRRSGSAGVPEVIELLDSGDERERLKRQLESELSSAAIMNEGQKAYIKKVVYDHIDQKAPEFVDVDDDPTAASPPATTTPPSTSTRTGSGPSRPDESVTLNVRMVADPDKRVEGSERAIARYEMRRVIRANRRDPLSRMLGDLAERVMRPAADLVLEYMGSKIFYNSVTPLQLGIQANDEVDMKCYERAVWDKVHGRGRADESGKGKGKEKEVEEVEEEGQETREASPVPNSSPPPVAVAKTVLKLRGTWGEVRMSVQSHITAAQMLQSYVHKCLSGEKQSVKDKLRVVLDGEVVEGTMKVGEMDVESGDILDVEQGH